MNKTIGIILGLAVACCTAALALSPPQYGLWRQINGSFGASPNVDVKEIYENEGVYTIDLIGSDADVCNGLAYVLTSQYNYGGIKVALRVLDKDGKLYTSQILGDGDDAESILRKHFQNALRDNPYFIRILEKTSGFMGKTIWLEFNPDVIQFFNDNIGDYYGNNNYVAAEAFQGVCKSQFGVVEGGTSITGTAVDVGFTTAPVKKESAALFRQYP